MDYVDKVVADLEAQIERLQAEHARLMAAAEALADDYALILGDGMTWDSQPEVLREIRRALGDNR